MLVSFVFLEAINGEGYSIMKNKLNNSPGENWVKMQYTHKLGDNMVTITIHYWKNTVTGATMGFKFKNSPGQPFFVNPVTIRKIK